MTINELAMFAAQVLREQQLKHSFYQTIKFIIIANSTEELTAQLVATLDASLLKFDPSRDEQQFRNTPLNNITICHIPEALTEERKAQDSLPALLQQLMKSLMHIDKIDLIKRASDGDVVRSLLFIRNARSPKDLKTATPGEIMQTACVNAVMTVKANAMEYAIVRPGDSIAEFNAYCGLTATASSTITHGTMYIFIPMSTLFSLAQAHGYDAEDPDTLCDFAKQFLLDQQLRHATYPTIKFILFGSPPTAVYEPLAAKLSATLLTIDATTSENAFATTSLNSVTLCIINHKLFLEAQRTATTLQRLLSQTFEGLFVIDNQTLIPIRTEAGLHHMKQLILVDTGEAGSPREQANRAMQAAFTTKSHTANTHVHTITSYDTVESFNHRCGVTAETPQTFPQPIAGPR